MKNKKKVYWVWLSLICRPASRRAVKILRAFGSAEAVFGASAAELLEGGTLKEKDRVYADILRHDTKQAEEIVSWCASNGVSIITPDDGNYPTNLLSLRDAPLVLYCVGELPDFNRECAVAVVGTRKMSEYGRNNAFGIGYGLAKGGAVVVSGLALGVDGMAMASAIAGGGVTVGVLGSGIDVVYPKEHLSLFRSVIKNGAVISEYPPSSSPQRNSFPQRNRIISGITQGTVVVEADAESGALITARCAVYQGKDLFAVPGNIGDSGAAGTNALIKEGAFAVTCASDILERYEYVYPHNIDVNSLKRNIGKVDIVSSAEMTVIKYGVTTSADRNNVYSKRSSFGGKVRSSVVRLKEEVPQPESSSGIPVIMPEDTFAAKVKDRSSSKDEKSRFAGSPSEPVRIDFEVLGETEKRVYNAMIPDTPMIPEELVTDELKIQDIMASLTLLEISGAVEAGAGGYYLRSSADDMPQEDHAE